MKLFITCIIIGLLLMGTGAVMGVASNNLKTVWAGASLCWISLIFFWLAKQVQPR